MNRFRKFKHIKYNANITEDSSDNISSDVEGTVKKIETDSMGGIDGSNSNIDISINVENGTGSGLGLSQLADDYSNDSYLFDKDNENSAIGSNLNPAERRLRQRSSGATRPLDESRLAECLTYLHRMISRKDKEDIFQFPVTDLIAPGYSIIIKNPMDLSTMKKKIDSHSYNNIMEYRDDLILMCENCLTYNKPDTIYYHAARKMLDYGLKMLSRDKLLSLRHTVRIMRALTSNELGFSLEGGELNEQSNDATRPRIQIQPKSVHSSRIILSKSKIFQKLDALYNKESYIVPPEGEDLEDDEDITEEVKELAKSAAERLAAKNKNGKMGFLRRNSNGTTGYNFLKRSNQNDEPSTAYVEKPVTIGNLCEGLQPGSYSMSNFIEEKKNKAKPMYYLENGPFSSHAPVYDSSYSNLSKEESDILLSSYGDEPGYQYAMSFMEYGKGTGEMFNKYVNSFLNNLSCNEHDKYLKYLNNKQQQQKLTNIPSSTTTTASTPASITN